MEGIIIKSYAGVKMSLSDKINEVGHDDDGTPDCDILEVYDVKQAVKELKEKVEDWDLKDSLHTVLRINLEGEMLEFIDEVFGEGLV